MAGRVRPTLDLLRGLAPAAAVIALLVGLLVPLPTAALDALLSLSLACAVVVLVATLQIRRVLDFAAFPVLLLALTFARLTLNVSTTRLILSQADAGRVIDAFAGLVVRGDLLVGAVMFGVITAIQYLVIARGAERVAEVAARFTLDSLPGEQVAIDRACARGQLGADEARARRAELSERADFFGRMDGVMRIVKGDAVVGLVITAINLVGGAVIGMRQGAGLIESLGVYGRLAVGDGLLAQLPAMLLALAAAMLVSRVDRRDAARSPRLFDWLEAPMLLAPATLLLILAAVPGMPTLAFGTTGVGLLLVALYLARAPAAAKKLASPEPLRVGVPASLRPELRESLTGALPALRQRCSATLNLPFPPLVLELRPELPERALALDLEDRSLARETIEAGAADDPDAWLLAGFHALTQGASALLELDAIEGAIERERRRRPAVVRRAMRCAESIDLLHIARAFVRERVPLPSVTALLTALAEERCFHDPNERSRWPELAREALADRWLRELHAGVCELGDPRWLRASPDLEDLLVARWEPGANRPRVHLSPKERQRVLARVQGEGPAIVLCSARARPALAALMTGLRPHVPVFALGELAAAGLEPPDGAALLDLE